MRRAIFFPKLASTWGTFDPTTNEVGATSGIRKEELKVKTYQDFYVRGDLPQQQKLRHEHYEAKRMEKTHMVPRAQAGLAFQIPGIWEFELDFVPSKFPNSPPNHLRTLRGSFSAVSKPIFVIK